MPADVQMDIFASVVWGYFVPHECTGTEDIHGRGQDTVLSSITVSANASAANSMRIFRPVAAPNTATSCSTCVTSAGRLIRRNDVHLVSFPPYAPRTKPGRSSLNSRQKRNRFRPIGIPPGRMLPLVHESVDTADQHLLRGFIRSTGLPIAFDLHRRKRQSGTSAGNWRGLCP